MDNTPANHLQHPHQYHDLRHASGGPRYGAPYDGSMTAIPQSQDAPFYFTKGQYHAGNHGNSAPMMQFQGKIVPDESYFEGDIQSSEALPTRPKKSSHSPKRRGRPSKESRGQPDQKRHRTTAQFVTHNQQNTVGHPEECNSTLGSSSSCCSSCSDGPPCDDPACAIPCAKSSCEKPICNEPCTISTGPQWQQMQLQQGFVPSSERMSLIQQTTSEQPWNPYGPWESHPINEAVLNTMIDPALTENEDKNQYTPGEYSSPRTPSIAPNMATPYSSLEAPLPTPHYNGQPPHFAYSTETSAVIGAGTMFNPFNDSNASNASPMYNCYWDGCSQLLPDEQNWIQHLHHDHVDPQMNFGCPLQSDGCPQTLGTNPLDHLQTMHGFNMNKSSYTCPAPTCTPAETYNDPIMFHNHFDQAHASPTQGLLQCRLHSCNSAFPDQHQLLSHITESHPLPLPAPKREDIDPATQTETAKYPPVIPDGELPGDVVALSCKWKLGQHVICGVVCETEKALQEHVKNAHLAGLSKNTGYICQWEGCSRPAKMKDKEGFSQRGKLERHMCSHTGRKYA
jgi:hypothetical protein